jgi:hypothetical protein
VPVVVSLTHAHHRHLGVHRGEEVRIEVGRAVVRDLEHVGPQVNARGDEIPLRLDLGVARQKDPRAADVGAQDQ